MADTSEAPSLTRNSRNFRPFVHITEPESANLLLLTRGGGEASDPCQMTLLQLFAHKNKVLFDKIYLELHINQL